MNIVPAILKEKTNRNGKVNIKIRIIHKQKVRDIGTKFYILPGQWEKDGKVSEEVPGADYINFEVNKTILGYQEKLLKTNYRQLDINRIVEILRDEAFTDSNFTSYFKKVVEKKAKINKRTGEIYQSTFDKIEKFDKKLPLLFENISAGWLKDFRDEMKRANKSKATMSLHFRNIRAVYNDAIDNNEVALSLYPFRRFKFESGSDEKTPLTLSQMKTLISLRPELPSHQNAQKVFLLSFVLIGMNSSDMYDVIKKDIVSGRLKYERNKNDKKYNVKLEPEALAIMKQMPGKTNLLNLADRFKTVKTFTTSVNILLKKVGKEIGMPDLHMYTARHTWASLAKNLLGTDDNDISAALGHSIGGVTQTYIHRNQEFIDKINRDLLDLVFHEPAKKKTRQKKEAGAS